MSQPSGWILAGATATGKSAVAQRIAELTGGTIISADAMLVYRGMDIGTAKPTLAERGAVPYAGLDLATPAESFSTGRWLEAVKPIAAQGGAIVAGGTGLYIKALAQGLDETPQVDPDLRARLTACFETGGVPALHAELLRRGTDPHTLPDPSNPRRLIRALEILETSGALPSRWQSAEPPRVTALRWPRALLHARIETRVQQMYAQGLLEETAHLIEAYPAWSSTASGAIGYAEAVGVLRGALTREAAMEKTIIRTRQLARRQETWFRHQTHPCWVDLTGKESIETVATRILEQWRKDGPTPFNA